MKTEKRILKEIEMLKGICDDQSIDSGVRLGAVNALAYLEWVLDDD